MKTTNTLAKRTALIAVLILASSAWLGAQTNQVQIAQPKSGPDRQPGTKTSDGSNHSQSFQVMKINRSSSLIGSTVRNQQGEALGRIRDLVVDFNSGQVAYVVLDNDLSPPHPAMVSEPTEVMAKPAHRNGSIVPLALYPPGYDLSNLFIYDPAVAHWVRGSNWVRGTNGTVIVSSHKLHAVPLRALQPDSAGTALILNADKDIFARSEGFDKNNWPAVTTAAWGAEPIWKDYQGTNTTQTGQDTDLQKRDYRDPTDATKEPYRNQPLSPPKP